MAQRHVSIRTDYITLGDLLKLAGAAGTGGQAKQLIQSGQVRVNGQVELRRGRKLYPGDSVAVAGAGSWAVAGKAGPGPGPPGEGT